MNICTIHRSAKAFINKGVNMVLKTSHYLNDLMIWNQYTDANAIWSVQVFRFKMKKKTSKHH